METEGSTEPSVETKYHTLLQARRLKSVASPFWNPRPYTFSLFNSLVNIGLVIIADKWNSLQVHGRTINRLEPLKTILMQSGIRR
jgi:hypothetical protein